jgi:hypothetical protein
MKANELRIGNIVEYNEDGVIFTVTETSLNGIRVTNDEETTWIEIDQFSGIKLTEDWLLRAGFVVEHKGNELNGFYSVYTLNSITYNTIHGWWINGKQHLEYPVPLNYVHQLQNLYFALTGQELFFKKQINENIT